MAGNNTDTTKTSSKQQKEKKGATDCSTTMTLRGQSTSNSTETLLRDLEDRLVGIMAQNSEQLEGRIAKRIAMLIENSVKHLSEQITGLEMKVKELECKCNLLGNENEELRRSQRASDVIIRGIPYRPNENPTMIIKCIAELVSHTLNPHVEAFRIRPKSTGTKITHGHGTAGDSPLVVKLSSQNEKRALIAAFWKCGGIKLKQINGFSSDDNIYVNESLTPKQSSLLREARRLRKNGLLYAVTTKNGMVHVKWKQNDTAVRITETDQLMRDTSGARTGN